MQFPGAGKPPTGVVFDSDMGSRIDTALALAMLYGFDGKNEARVICVTVSRTNVKAAAFCDAIGRFYASGGFMRSLPVGMSIAGKITDETPMLTATLAKKAADGQPAYKHEVNDINDTADVAAVIRNAYTAQYDGNSITVLAGPATNLVDVLKLPGSKELIAKKVKLLAVSGGPHLDTDAAAAKQLFAEWPTPIVISTEEIGKELLFPGDSIDRDFAWSPSHPIVDAYKAYKPVPYDAPAGDMATLLYAIRPQENYFKLSDPGTISVDASGKTHFTEDADGKHRQLLYDPTQKEKIIKTFVELASAKPVPRQRFFRPQQQQQQQQVPMKPPTPAPPKP
jgi:hypothetical protein